MISDIPGLAARWLQWAASSDESSSPIADESGAFAGHKQPTDVWFVAGNFGGASSRRFDVPAERPLFMPAFCMWSRNALTNSDLPRSFGVVKLDGGEIPMDANSTGPIKVRGALGNPVNGGSLFGTKMHVAGHWAYAESLAPGQHLLEIHGGDGHGWTTSVRAEITVS
ncbi:hypothetical protein ACFU7D_11550 [Nocardioides sp. NPDC057577]|uniref:hypothetical protein n=1 Tax=Nocardioides sp. NPDC057577 TaxID=3346171 RepID=UPI003670477B